MSKGLSLSLIDDNAGAGHQHVGTLRKRRREVLYCALANVRASFAADPNRGASSLLVDVGSMQIDNHLGGAPFDVCVAPRAIDKTFRASGTDNSQTARGQDTVGLDTSATSRATDAAEQTDQNFFKLCILRQEMVPYHTLRCDCCR